MVAEIRQLALSEYHILWEMDQGGSVLSYKGVEIMRKAEVGAT
mgnify:CR=1 FL=1